MNKLLLSAVALAVATPAMAQIQAPNAPIARVQASQTRDQVVAKARNRFARMDLNRDGFVAGNEMQSLRGQNKGQRQAGERRGRGGRERVAANPGAAFDRLDANRDGSISRDEFSRGREIRSERKLARNGAPGVRGARMGGGRKGGGMMRMADLDRDGRVSLQEATNSALQRFDRVDANRDGQITRDERRHNREQRKQMRAPRAS